MHRKSLDKEIHIFPANLSQNLKVAEPFFDICIVRPFISITEISACEPNPCKYGGICTRVGTTTSAECKCREEYTGNHCEGLFVCLFNVPIDHMETFCEGIDKCV